MKKRILSILLCCVMLVGLLPTVALAEGGCRLFRPHRALLAGRGHFRGGRSPALEAPEA